MARDGEEHSSFRIYRDERLDALVAEVCGPRSYERARALWGDILHRVKSDGTARVLLDLRQAEYRFDLDEAIEMFAELARPLQGLTVAIVLERENREYGIVMNAVADIDWNVVRLFHDIGEARDWLANSHAPDGFNIGMNCGTSAGQTVFHFHCHVIPRYHGDMEDPRGGIRNVIPGMGDH